MYVPPAYHALSAIMLQTKLPAMKHVPTMPANGVPIRLPTNISRTNDARGRSVAIESSRAGVGIGGSIGSLNHRSIESLKMRSFNDPMIQSFNDSIPSSFQVLCSLH